jgi:endonuclease G
MDPHGTPSSSSAMTGSSKSPCHCHEPYDPQRAIQSLAADFRELVDAVANLTRPPAEATPPVRALAALTGPTGLAELSARLERIVGGRPTHKTEFPECCCVGGRGPKGNDVYFCSGTLIAPDVVLTAGHCTELEILRVLLGGSSVEDLDAEVIGVKAVLRHAGYQADPVFANDLCLLVLERDATIAPAPLATMQQLATAASVHLVGFGYNDPVRPHGFGIKRQVEVAITALQRAAGEDLSHDVTTYGFHPGYEFVAGRKKLGRDSCNGDSGGPAYVFTQGRFALAGVTSRSTSNADRPCGDGGVYVRPDRFTDWIGATLASASVAWPR